MKVDIDGIENLLFNYDQAMASQERAGNGPDAKLMVIANYGDLAISILRKMVAKSERGANEWVENIRKSEKASVD